MPKKQKKLLKGKVVQNPEDKDELPDETIWRHPAFEPKFADSVMRVDRTLIDNKDHVSTLLNTIASRAAEVEKAVQKSAPYHIEAFDTSSDTSSEGTSSEEDDSGYDAQKMRRLFLYPREKRSEEDEAEEEDDSGDDRYDTVSSEEDEAEEAPGAEELRREAAVGRGGLYFPAGPLVMGEARQQPGVSREDYEASVSGLRKILSSPAPGTYTLAQKGPGRVARPLAKNRPGFDGRGVLKGPGGAKMGKKFVSPPVREAKVQRIIDSIERWRTNRTVLLGRRAGPEVRQSIEMIMKNTGATETEAMVALQRAGLLLPETDIEGGGRKRRKSKRKSRKIKSRKKSRKIKSRKIKSRKKSRKIKSRKRN
jgi:hypothetical protein